MVRFPFSNESEIEIVDDLGLEVELVSWLNRKPPRISLCQQPSITAINFLNKQLLQKTFVQKFIAPCGTQCTRRSID